MSCWGNGGCTIDAVTVGEPVTVSGNADGCDFPERPLVPVAGVNEVRLVCGRLRTVLGVIRGPLHAVVRVHCGDAGRNLSKTGLFQLLCPAGAQTLEVQVDGEPVARQIAIPVGDPALVEIPL
jgi:hypothetical protein